MALGLEHVDEWRPTRPVAPATAIFLRAGMITLLGGAGARHNGSGSSVTPLTAHDEGM